MPSDYIPSAHTTEGPADERRTSPKPAWLNEQEEIRTSAQDEAKLIGFIKYLIDENIALHLAVVIGREMHDLQGAMLWLDRALNRVSLKNTHGGRHLGGDNRHLTGVPTLQLLARYAADLDLHVLPREAIPGHDVFRRSLKRYHDEH